MNCYFSQSVCNSQEIPQDNDLKGWERNDCPLRQEYQNIQEGVNNFFKNFWKISSIYKSSQNGIMHSYVPITQFQQVSTQNHLVSYIWAPGTPDSPLHYF